MIRRHVKRAISPLYHEANEQKRQVGIWRDNALLQNLAVRNASGFCGAPSGNKFVGVLYRRGKESLRRLRWGPAFQDRFQEEEGL
eukprot:1157205-Pelagomonas_calceolata.AAC.11